MSTFDRFTNQYSMDKTLCFDLLPLSDITEIAKNSILRDEERHHLSTEMKELMDVFHKSYINQILTRFALEFNEDISEEEHKRNGKMKELFSKSFNLLMVNRPTDEDKAQLEGYQAELRSIISKAFTGSAIYKSLFNKDIFGHLKNYANNDKDQLKLINKFDGFVGYFDSFFKNRKNMYTSSPILTAIPFRIVNQNFPKFVENIKAFDALANSRISSCIDTVYKDYETILNITSLKEMFNTDYYIECLCQRDIDAYNYVIGGMEQEGERKLTKGLNQYVKEYNDTCPKSERLPLFVPLFKQILSDREKISWLKDEFSSDSMLLDAIHNCHCNITGSLTELRDLLTNITQYETNGIFISNDESLSLISQRVCGRYSVISEAIQSTWARSNPQKARETEEKYIKRIKDAFKREKQFSISYINECLGYSINEYFSSLGECKDGENLIKKSYFEQAKDAYNNIVPILQEKDKSNLELINDEAKVACIKEYLESLKNIQRFISPLIQKEVAIDTDAEFYNKFNEIVEKLNQITNLYNKVRNRLTRRPYNEDKFQLFFDNNSKLLGGWTDSKTEKSDNGTQYGGYIFRKLNDIGEYDYYLGVSADTQLFRAFNTVEDEDKSRYERLNYYQLGAKTFFGGCYTTAIGHAFAEDKDKLCSYMTAFSLEHGNDSLNTAIIRENLKDESKRKTTTPKGFLTLISNKDESCYQSLLNDRKFTEISKYVISNIKRTMQSVHISSMQQCACKNYNSFVEAMDDVDICCKSDKVLEFFHVSNAEMTEAITRGKKRLYMFKISNKDLSYASHKDVRKSRGRDNLHTMYFKALMDGGHSIYDLGTASIYFRRKTEGLQKEQATHPKGNPISNKNPRTISKKATSTFDYDIQKDARFTRDSFKLHLSLRMNFAKGKPDERALNKKVLQTIKNGEVRHIIGIDRGERHLLYLTIIDMKGNIVCQKSLNIISNEYNETNYQHLLSARMEERDQNRKSWMHIDNIKNLKEGYLSQVVHEIANMVIEYDAIVILENLNGGFMRGRQKIEKQVYQKFEKALIDKLNFYVNKSYDVNALGGLYNPLQLTYPYKNNASADGQNGVLFYIPAWNTSKIDPVTGFVNLLHLKYESIKASIEDLANIRSIAYNKQHEYYEFAIDYAQKSEGARTCWTICSYGDRIEQKRDMSNNGDWISRPIESLTNEFDKLFAKYNVIKNHEIKEQIINIKDSDFYKELYRLLKLTLQMRNSITGTETDYLISPVADENGNFYDSRTCAANLPKNADANGAYNIARKGLWVVRQIKECADDSKLKLAISNKEWLKFAQDKPYLLD